MFLETTQGETHVFGFLFRSFFKSLWEPWPPFSTSLCAAFFTMHFSRLLALWADPNIFWRILEEKGDPKGVKRVTMQPPSSTSFSLTLLPFTLVRLTSARKEVFHFSKRLAKSLFTFVPFIIVKPTSVP